MDQLRLLSVNVGEVRPIEHGKPSGKTGIFKLPRATPVEITPLGLRGDAIVDTENHGGLEQAVYIYTMPDYAWWSERIGQPLAPGTFGENLTLSDLESATLHIGDRFRGNKVLLEVTSPRVPCVTIAARMKDPNFVRKFKEGERPGVYCRVIETGYVQAGDAVEWIPYPGEPVTILEFFRSFYRRDASVEELSRFLRVPIHSGHRAYCEELLQRLNNSAE